MNDFELQPWEVPQGTEVGDAQTFVTFGPLLFQGLPTMFRLRLVAFGERFNVVFVRPQESQTNYVLLREEKAIPLGFKAKVSQTKAARSITEEPGWTFGQLFRVEGQFCVVRGKQGFWLPPNLQDGNVTEFRVKTAPRVTDNSSAVMWNWLQNEWSKPESEVRFSWNWHGWNKDDKHRFYCEQVPSWRELHDLMRWVAQVEGLPEGATWWRDHIYLIGHPELEARLSLWGEVLRPRFRHFKPFPAKSPLCLVQHSQAVLTHPLVEGQETSSHEQLEARFRLREWLELNAPDRIETLLAS